AAEEMLLHLLGEPLAGAGVGQRQPVLVDEHRLVTQPLRPRLLRDVLVDALAEFARIGREVEAFGFSAKLHAVNGTSHRGGPPIIGRDKHSPSSRTPLRAASHTPATCVASCRAPASAGAGRLPRRCETPARGTSAPCAW